MNLLLIIELAIPNRFGFGVTSELLSKVTFALLWNPKLHQLRFGVTLTISQGNYRGEINCRGWDVCVAILWSISMKDQYGFSLDSYWGSQLTKNETFKVPIFSFKLFISLKLRKILDSKSSEFHFKFHFELHFEFQSDFAGVQSVSSNHFEMFCSAGE